MSERPPRFVNMDGSLVPYGEGTIHIDSPAFRYGAMVFEGIRGYWNSDLQQLLVFRLDEHIQRLQDSMKVMRYDPAAVPSASTLKAAVLETIRANDFRFDVHARLMAWVDGTGSSSSLGPIRFGVAAHPHGRTYDVDNGISACVSSWVRTADNAIPPRVKCAANYQNARLPLMQAKADHYDIALMLDRDGHLTEVPTACAFLIRRGRLVTPPVYMDILESITRESVMALATDLEIAVEERPVDRTELYTASEVFICGSGAELAPVVSVDRLPVGDGKPGQFTRKVQQAYFDAARGVSVSRASWLTAVY